MNKYAGGWIDDNMSHDNDLHDSFFIKPNPNQEMENQKLVSDLTTMRLAPDLKIFSSKFLIQPNPLKI